VWSWHLCANSAKAVTDGRKHNFVANSYTAPFEKDFKIDANGGRAFMGHFLCGVETVKRFERPFPLQRHKSEKDRQNVDVSPPGKFSANAHGYFHPFSKL